MRPLHRRRGPLLGNNFDGRLGDGVAMNVIPLDTGYLDFQLHPRVVVGHP